MLSSRLKAFVMPTIQIAARPAASTSLPTISTRTPLASRTAVARS
jgi:hypothetical protein